MAMLFRLRRRLAHLICPELGVDARLKAVRLVNGFFDPKAARQARQARDCAPKEPFLHPDHMAELLAKLRSGRVEAVRYAPTSDYRLTVATSERWEAAVSHVLAADDPFLALDEIIGALRRENARTGVADREFAARLCGLMVQADVATAPPAGESK